MDDIYTENILEKAKSKVFDISQNTLETKNTFDMSSYICGNGTNPSCGDIGDMYFLLEENENKLGCDYKIIKDVKLKKEGCAISQSGLVMLSEKVIGKSIEELKSIVPGDVYNMLGVKISPSRAGCALLCYNALEDFLKKENKTNIL